MTTTSFEPPTSGSKAEALQGCKKIPSDGIGYLLTKVACRMKDQLDVSLEPVGLRCRHYGLLMFLDKMGSMSQHELGELLRTDRSTMVSIIDEAEKAGICERAPHPEDRRAYLIQLTPAGRAMVGKVQKIGKATEESFLKALNAQEKEMLRDFLKRLF